MTYFNSLARIAREEANATSDNYDNSAHLLRDLASAVEVLDAENDSLRRQLDGMTEQFGWAHKYGGLIMPFTHDAPLPEDQYNTKVRRLVGPWVEAE